MTGYGVDIALLIDAHREAGLEAIAQVDLDVRQNAHQPLRELGPMAFSVLRALASGSSSDGRLAGPAAVDVHVSSGDELRVARRRLGRAAAAGHLRAAA